MFETSDSLLDPGNFRFNKVFKIGVAGFLTADLIADSRVEVVDTAVIVKDAENDSKQNQQRWSPLDEDGIH